MIEKMKKFTALENLSSILADLKKSIDGQAKDIEDSLIQEMADNGISSMKIDGKTVYMSATMWASSRAGMSDQLIEALKECGLGHVVKESVNTQTLSAICRENVDESIGQCSEVADLVTLDNRIKACLNITKKTNLKIRG